MSAHLLNRYAPPQAEIVEPDSSTAQSWIVQGVAVGLVLATALWSPLSFQPLHNRITWHGVQILLAVALGVLLPRGFAWVRWTVVACCAAIGLEQLYTGSVLHEIFSRAAVAGSVSWVYLIAFGVAGLHFGLASLLVLPRSVRNFYAGGRSE